MVNPATSSKERHTDTYIPLIVELILSQDVLVERMATATTCEASRIRKALLLCDKFLNTRQGQPQDLERLKSQVQAALLPPQVKARAKAEARAAQQAAVDNKPASPQGDAPACSLPAISDRVVTVCSSSTSTFRL